MDIPLGTEQISVSKCNDASENRMERKRLENNQTKRSARKVVLAARLHHAQGIAMKQNDAALQSLAALNHPEGFERHFFERTFEVKLHQATYGQRAFRHDLNMRSMGMLENLEASPAFEPIHFQTHTLDT